MKNKKNVFFIVFIVVLAALIGASFIWDIEWGRRAGANLWTNLWEMIQIVPPAFVLIALFDKWVHREQVERHLGEAGGIQGYLWALLLAGVSVGGVYVMFPLAASLHKKGASLKIVFAYLGFAGICRIPMMMFEASYLGPLFTAVRLLTAIPLAGFAGALLGAWLEKRQYSIRQPEAV
jgi:uncharacterized membrane protein YraQ (UPF0718 family)